MFNLQNEASRNLLLLRRGEYESPGLVAALLNPKRMQVDFTFGRFSLLGESVARLARRATDPE